MYIETTEKLLDFIEKSPTAFQAVDEMQKRLTENGFERTGFEFVGWSTQATGSKQYSNSESVVNLSSQNGSKITLYAVWKEEEYTITFNANGGTIQEDTKKVVYSSTQNNDVSALNPTKTGYIFSGWYTSTSGGIQVYGSNGKCNVNANGYWTSSKQWIYTDNITLYAQWTAITYQIIFNGNGNTSGIMTNMECKYGAIYSLSANGFKKDGYEFIGWATSANGEVVYQNQQEISNLSTINGTEINLYAKWKLILVYPSGVALDKSSAIIDLSTNNKTVKLNATILPSNANTNLNLVWSTNTPNVAVVDQNGLVTGIGNGFATITVTTQNGYTAQCNVIVQTSIISIVMNQSNITIERNQVIKLTTTVNPNFTTEKVNWISDNQQIATIDDNGILTAKEVGNVTITAQNKNGKISAKCSITIVHEPITINMSGNISGTKSQQTVLEWNSSSIPAGAKSIKMSWSCGVTNAISDRRYYWDFIENGNKNSWQTDALGVNTHGSATGISRSLRGTKDFSNLSGGTSYSVKAVISSFLYFW